VRYHRGHEREMVAAVRARAERARALRSLLVRDSLTGLLTHTRTKERLSAELERARRYGGALAFAMVDIDHFKQVNDQHGHQVGDRVIKSLSRLLTERLRRSDIVGRYGGEEFAVIMTEASAEQAREVMDQVRQAFQQIAFTARRGDSFHCAFSCGVAQFPGFDDVDSLTHAADDAMYEAKRGGRNRVVVRTSVRAPASSSGVQGPAAPAGPPAKG
jgi:diguanylate cyclase (GGDEF)-like protein